MAIATETIVLKVEGKTDGAVRETRRLALAQRLLQREVQSTSKAMAEVPATKTAGLISRLGDGLKAAGIDAKGFSQGLRDIGKGLVFDQIRQGLKALNTDLDGVAGSALSAGVNGAAMGAAFGGPVGAAIGGVAGALVGLIRHTDRQSAASLRAAEAARKHAAALQMVAEGETKTRGERRSLREREELAEEELNQARLTATRLGLGQDSADVQRAVRELREIQAEREAMNRADGVIWLEQRKRELERINAIKDVEAARRSGILTDIEAARRIRDINNTLGDSLDIVSQYKNKQKDTAEAVERLNRALQAGQIDAKGYTKLLREIDEDFRDRDDKRKQREQKAKERAKERAKELRKLADEEIKQLTDNLVSRLEGEVRDDMVDPLGSPTDYTAGIDTEEVRKQYARAAEQAMVVNNRALIARQEMAEAIQREIDLMREYTGLVGEAYGAIVDGSGGALTALKNVAKQHLLALGTREAVEAASQFAYGLGALANPLFAGAAAMHFASAAKHAGAAALAGVGVAAIGAIGGGGGGASSASSAASAVGGYGGGSSGQPTQTVTNYYIIGDSFSEDSPRMRQRNFERVIEIGMQRTSVGRAE